MLEVCEDTGHANFAVATVRAAIVADPRIGGRLALWGRRLVGEALSQAQHVAAERDGLASLVLGGDTARDGPGRARRDVPPPHRGPHRRMQTLGLQA